MPHKTIITSLLWISFLYIAYCTFLFLMQRQILFPEGLAGPASGAPNLPGIEITWLDADSACAESWYLPPEGAKAGHRYPAVVFAHGNAELIDGCIGEFMPFTRMGAGLLLVEYPGYGRSAGSPSQDSINTVYTAAYDWLVSRSDVDPGRIVIAGRSLGGGVACQLAGKRPSAAMILMSTFTSARSFAGRYFVPEFLVRDPFDNLSVLRSYTKPVLVIHGTRDDVIPYAQGIAVADTAPEGRLISYACAHNDCPPSPRIFFQDMETFLRDAGVLGGAAP